jgi:hypothetical protein
VKVQLMLAESQPESSKLKPVKNEGWVKPRGGLWTSTYQGPKLLSGWAQWCSSEEPGWIKPAWLLTPKRSVRIVHVRSLIGLKNLQARYPLPSPIHALHSKQLDFEAIACAYDGVHLTEAGQWATRLTFPLSLYGWDCESTLWFRWVFSEVRKER